MALLLSAVCCYTSRQRRTIPKTTSGKIARAMCKKAHKTGALDADTVFLWGSDATAHLSSASGTATSRMATAEMDAQAERDETPWSPPGGGSEGGGREESKSYRGEGGGRGCPTDMPVDAVLEGVQFEVARILKADATAIPTVRPRDEMGADVNRTLFSEGCIRRCVERSAGLEVNDLFRLPTLIAHAWFGTTNHILR